MILCRGFKVLVGSSKKSPHQLHPIISVAMETDWLDGARGSGGTRPGGLYADGLIGPSTNKLV